VPKLKDFVWSYAITDDEKVLISWKYCNREMSHRQNANEIVVWSFMYCHSDDLE